MYKLPEEHLEKAKEIALNNRKKKFCKKCYDRAYIGTTEDNLLVICQSCVNLEKAMNEWKDYVKTVPELMENYSDLFEDEEN